ncbi:MAG: hypothetical protein CND86_02480 [Bacteroidetes bacterium MED-G21]|nr:MAG: hypothetical protein CND86_02480 [Bacteroidetes bacterium MED-G21]|tara:strand:- start:204 stop:482 length:279 start_codon:yes stop_codon:yes gene_type:complete
MNKLKDHMLIGVVIGVLIPIVLYAVLLTFLEYALEENPIRESTIQVIALFANFPLLRITLSKYQKDRLGRGILLSTFVMAIWYIVQHDLLEF